MELEVVDVRTRRVRKIAQSASQLAPSWSPDGRSIVYQAGGDVYVATLDGSRRRLGRRAAPAFGPSVARIVSGRLGIAYAAPATALPRTLRHRRVRPPEREL